MKENLSLVYITREGEKYTGEETFNLFFSDTPETVIGDYWDTICMDMVGIPDKKYIKKVYTLDIKDIEIGLLCEDEHWRYLDGVYGLTSIAYEFISDYKEYEIINGDLDLNLLKFFYGDSLESVKEKLKIKNLKLKEIDQ